MNKIILLHKEKGMTSRDAVNIASKKLNIKKIGHTGTLDPLAEGVLVLLTGKYTKLSNLLMATKKEYIAKVKMGFKTDTLDIEGEKIEENNKLATYKELEKLFKTFPKTYLQEVPLYSAVKVNGKKLYQYARNKEEVLLPKREVHIYKLELLEVKEDTFTFKTVVSKGTYIRSLINDLGEKLGLLFTMLELTRTKQGSFDIKDTCYLKDLTLDYQGPSLEQSLDIKVEIVDEKQAFKIRNGQKLPNPNLEDYVLFETSDKKPLAIYKKEGDQLKMDVMLGE